MNKCIKCGSYAFNLYKDGIDQGGLCDVHYWQGRAHRAEALSEQPAQQQEPVAAQSVMTVRIWRDKNSDQNAEFKNWHKLPDGEHILYTTPQAQPAQQQEPVAVVSGYYGGQCVILPIDPARIFNSGTVLYTSPQPAQPAQPSKPLTDEQTHEAIGTAGVDLLELAKLWSDNKIHIYQFDNEARKIIKGVLHRAHGIKGDA